MKDDRHDKSPVPRTPLLVWLAQGFGVGRIPWGPGTWGSILGVIWYWALAAWSPSLVWFYIVALLAVVAAISVCGQAEILLGQHDPPSVVLDEIVALPFCFSLTIWMVGKPAINSPAFLREAIAGFVLFRVFDITKPPPIRQLQKLPGGWGVVIDDLAAALVAALCLWGLHKAGVLA